MRFCSYFRFCLCLVSIFNFNFFTLGKNTFLLFPHSSHELTHGWLPCKVPYSRKDVQCFNCNAYLWSDFAVCVRLCGVNSLGTRIFDDQHKPKNNKILLSCDQYRNLCFKEFFLYLVFRYGMDGCRLKVYNKTKSIR